MSVGEVCNREVVVISPEEGVVDAAKLMRHHHVGDLMVVEQRDGQNVPLGIVTDRDLVLEVVAAEVAPTSLRASDVMSTELVTASEEDDVLQTIERMRDKGVRRIPVVNAQGGLEGIFTVDDVVELLAEEMSDLAKAVTKEQWRELKQRP